MINDDDAITCESDNSFGLRTKDEERQPLITPNHSSPVKHSESHMHNVITSGEEGDDEDDGNDSDLFTFAISSQNTKLSNMTIGTGQTTNCQSLMHLVKGNIGTGILAMPSAFANAGLWVGTITLPIMGIICIHCMHMLLNCNKVLCERLGLKNQLDYEEVAEKSLSIGPEPLRRFTTVGRRMVQLFLMITQFGFCCVYSLFVADNVRMTVVGLSKQKYGDWDVRIYMLMELPFMILLNFVKSLRHLAIASALANLLQCTGLLIVFYNLFQHLPNVSERPASANIANFPLYIGTAIYAFEGIGLVLPIQKDMKNPNAFPGACGVLNWGMTIVASLYTATGFFGYLRYGGDVKGSITLNLPSEPLYDTCRIMFTIAIFLSYAIQFYVPIMIIWPWMETKFHLKEDNRKNKFIEMGVRALLVTFTFALAAAIPKLELFISLVGAFSSSCLALIFPPLMDTAVRWDEGKGTSTWTLILCKNMVISLFGIIGFATGTYASVREIVKEFSR